MKTHQTYARAYVAHRTLDAKVPTHETLPMSQELTTESHALFELINAAQALINDNGADYTRLQTAIEGVTL